jgi:hypothetical protein
MTERHPLACKFPGGENLDEPLVAPFERYRNIVTAVDADSLRSPNYTKERGVGCTPSERSSLRRGCSARTLAIRDVCGLLLQADRRGSGLKVIEGGGLATNGVDDAPIAAAELPDLR